MFIVQLRYQLLTWECHSIKSDDPLKNFSSDSHVDNLIAQFIHNLWVSLETFHTKTLYWQKWGFNLHIPEAESKQTQNLHFKIKIKSCFHFKYVEEAHIVYITIFHPLFLMSCFCLLNLSTFSL